jgi:CBS domain-containing protein
VLNLDGKPVGLITSMDVVAALVNAIDEQEALAR